MGAGLHDAALVEHQDAVGADDARQAMGADQYGPPFHQPVQGIEDHRLVLGIDRRQGLVEHQDWCVPEQRPGDGDALALSAGQPQSPFTDHGPIALGQTDDEVMGVGGAGGGLQFLGRRLGLAEAQVVLDGAVEQVGVLAEDGELAANLVEAELADIAAADAHPSPLRVVESQEQAYDRRLAGAAGADDTDPLPRRDVKFEAEMGAAPAAGIGEAHVLEIDGRRQAADVGHRRDVADQGLRIEELEDAPRRRQPVHALVAQFPELAQGTEDLDPHHQDDEQGLDAHGSGADPVGADAEGDGGTRGDAGVGDQARQRIGRQHPHGAAEQLMRLGGEQAGPGAALAEGLQGRQPLDGIQELGRESVVRLLPPA